MSDTIHEEAPAVSPAIQAELDQFEAEERERLGLAQPREQWRDLNPNQFSKEQRPRTKLLVSGLTHSADLFIRAALAGAGYQIETLDCPDNSALRLGKEFGNRGQCNPTYFTVGNLIKHLTHLRDELGMSKQEIIDSHVFMTAGACGPCRFGMYVTEYRKALRDSGFDGFRVLLISQTGAVQSASGGGLDLGKKDVVWAFVGLMLGDILNAMTYRIRPYELEEGATDRAVDECRAILSEALENRKALFRAVRRCRRILGAVTVDRTRVRPRVSIIGEFWAMTTEGDGNYRMQRFIESEGGEVEIQIVTAWLLYLIWEGRWDTRQRMMLHGEDAARKGLSGVQVARKRAILWAGDRGLRVVFYTLARMMGLRHYHLPDMDEVAEVANEFYDNHLRGGEGHMEVGKVIHNVVHNKVNMTLSIKPFGCMPSSGVSDGVQSLITELHPRALFLPIETSGDAATNAYSRVQMQLFKARQVAQQEVDEVLAAQGLTMDQVREHVARSPELASSLHRSPHHAGCTAADLAQEVAGRLRRS